MQVTRTSGEVMVVSWTPLTYVEARGFISNYTVIYFPQAGVNKRQTPGGGGGRVNVTGMESNMTTIRGLDPNTDYGVQMFAANGAGEGGRSDVLVSPVPTGGIHNYIKMEQM